jgi:choline dehydrogenase-like flavoprotein
MHSFSDEDLIYMFVDARRLDDGSSIQAEVCIIGGGVAGITLALELGGRGIRTCVLESGGFTPDRATRDLYRGENIGLPYRFADGCRSRFLGGSSNCWGGECRPMDEQDFASRDWVPYSGWPFAKSELLPYYDRSHEILRIGPNRFDTEFWVAAIGRADVRRIPFVTDEVVDGVSQFSAPLRFGEFYRNDLGKSHDVTVFLYANAVDIETDANGTKVQSVKLATLTGRTARVTAIVFVLAAGGIENARLLLVSNKNQPAGLGNHNDLVGRFFMDHPRLTSGQLRFHQTWAHNKLYDDSYSYHNEVVSAFDTCISAQLMLASDVQAREKLLNAHVRLVTTFFGAESEAANALIRIKHRMEQKAPPGRGLPRDLLALVAHPIDSAGFIAAHYLRLRSLVRGCRFLAIVEPVPDPESRVTLSEQRDQLGMNRVSVKWRLDPLVRRTFDRNFALVARELSRAGVADVSLDPEIEGGEWPDSFSQEGTWHHMGTTRMHDSPKLGVVDRHCRVHGIKNLYVSGGSVLPTAGGIFPTITIIALALRLTDHVAKELGPTVAPFSNERNDDEALRVQTG